MGYSYDASKRECADRLNAMPESMSEHPEVDGYHVDWTAQDLMGNAAVQEGFLEDQAQPFVTCDAMDWVDFVETAEPWQSNLAETLCAGRLTRGFKVTSRMAVAMKPCRR